MKDWFEKITGFRELPYAETQSRLSVENGRLCSTHSSNRFAVGTLETPTLGELRARCAGIENSSARSRISCIAGDARQLHSEAQYRGGLFQVASQFNLLEMVGPSITPAHGVSGYAHDRTQGPACAIAAGAGTIFRNYLVPVGDQLGQSLNRQIDCLADVGQALGNSRDSLWTMRNGYALCTQKGLENIDQHLERLPVDEYDQVRSLLRVGLQWDVQVTDVDVAGWRPQHETPPSGWRAQVKPPGAAMSSTTPESPLTAPAVSRSVLVPSPSWPALLVPHAWSAPSASTNRVWPSPGSI